MRLWGKRQPPHRAAFEGSLPHLTTQRLRQDVSTELAPASKLLRNWSKGLALASPVFVMAAIMIRGWQDGKTLPLIAILGCLAFSWSYLLVRVSRHPALLQHVDHALWINSVVLGLLVTAMIGATGASLSPLFWLYLVLIAAEILQDRHPAAGDPARAAAALAR